MFSMCPPSDRFNHDLLSDMPIAVISRSRQTNPGAPIAVLRGFAIQNPRRMLRSVSSAERVGIDPRPICGDAAAPDTAMAVARSTSAPSTFHWLVGRYPTAGAPDQHLEKRKKSPLRSLKTGL